MESERILIIDDEPDVIAYLKLALEDHGYTVETADSASSGLESARKLLPKVICLDILMPGQTGVSLYRTLRSEPGLEAIPVVIISGISGDRQDLNLKMTQSQDGEKFRAPDAYIEKPIILSQLFETLTRVIR
jgi:CheY-like chemotaxis protein